MNWACPWTFLITGGQVNDCTQAIALLGQHKAEAVLADKGYDADVIVEHVEAMGAKAVIPPKRNRKVQREYDKDSLQAAESDRTLLQQTQVFSPLRHAIRKIESLLPGPGRSRLRMVAPAGYMSIRPRAHDAQ